MTYNVFSVTLNLNQSINQLYFLYRLRSAVERSFLLPLGHGLRQDTHSNNRVRLGAPADDVGVVLF